MADFFASLTGYVVLGILFIVFGLPILYYIYRMCKLAGQGIKASLSSNGRPGPDVIYDLDVTCPQCAESLTFWKSRSFPLTRMESQHLVSRDDAWWSLCKACGTILVYDQSGQLGDWQELVRQGYYLPLYCSNCEISYFDEHRVCPMCEGVN